MISQVSYFVRKIRILINESEMIDFHNTSGSTGEFLIFTFNYY